MAARPGSCGRPRGRPGGRRSWSQVAAGDEFRDAGDIRRTVTDARRGVAAFSRSAIASLWGIRAHAPSPPAAQVVVDAPPGREIVRQEPPARGCRGSRPRSRACRPCAAGRRIGDHRRDRRPSGVGQVAGTGTAAGAARNVDAPGPTREPGRKPPAQTRAGTKARVDPSRPCRKGGVRKGFRAPKTRGRTPSPGGAEAGDRRLRAPPKNPGRRFAAELHGGNPRRDWPWKWLSMASKPLEDRDPPKAGGPGDFKSGSKVPEKEDFTPALPVRCPLV